MSSNQLSSNDRIVELSKSEQILNLATDNGSDEPSNASSQTNLEQAALTDKLSVQAKPHSVHSLNDVIKSSDSSAVHNDQDLVKSDSQLNNLDDSFISPEIKIDRSDLNRSLENLKQNSFDLLEPKSSSSSSNKASLNNLLLDERSLNELSVRSAPGDRVKSAAIEIHSPVTTPANNTPLYNTPISQTTFLDPEPADDTAPLLDQTSITIISAVAGRPPPGPSAIKNQKRPSSLGGLNEVTSRKLRDKGKLSTGSIDFIPNWSLSQTNVPDSNRINVGLEDEMIIESYELSRWRQFLYFIVCFLTIGLLLIYCEIRLSLKIRLTHRRCALESATTVVLIDSQNNEYVEPIVRPDKDEDISNGQIHFYHKKLKYLWNADKQRFIRLTGLESEKCAVIYSYSSGLSENEAEEKFALYGLNSIYIDVQPLYKIVIDSLKNPFYVYQAFIVIVWCVQLYYQFAFCVFMFSILTLALQGYETRKVR